MQNPCNCVFISIINMEFFDKVAGGGFIGSFGVYYINTSTHVISNLNLDSEVYDWTIGGFPEFFTGMFGVRLANLTLEKILENDVISDFSFNFLSWNLMDNINYNSLLYSTIVAGGGIIGLGTLDEIYNFSNGSEDLMDVVKYSLGVFVAGIYNFKNN